MATRLELYGTPTCPVLAGHANVTVEGQFSVAGLTLMFTVLKPLSVAVPVTLWLPPVSGGVKLPDVATVSVLAVAVKVVELGVVGELKL